MIELPTEPPSWDAFLTWGSAAPPALPALGAALGLLYLLGWATLIARGRRWPVMRVVSFLAACGLLIALTGLRLEDYGYGMFSVFMFQQLTLMILIPPLLVWGAPGRMLLLTTPSRGFGRSLRRAALTALRSRLARWILHPAFGIPLFLVTYYGLYLSEIADGLLASIPGHIALELGFLVAGVLFAVPILSPDPLPVRQSYPAKILDVAVEVALHAFFGVILMIATTPLVEAFASPPASWDLDPLVDQQIAGGLAWSYGEGPTVLMLLWLLGAWYRDETLRTRRRDVEIDRDGDAELEAYNAFLQRLESPRGDQRG